MQTLNKSQIDQYTRDGYLLVSGLVPDEIAQRADAFLVGRLDSAKPNSLGHFRNDDPRLLACYTPHVLRAAAELAGEDVLIFALPEQAYVIPTFVTKDEWQWPEPHIDHAIKEHGHKTFPRAFRIACMTYLHDVPRHGGGTIVWPGSNLKLQILAESDRERYETMWALNMALKDLDLGAPLELTPRKGDVLFFHYLCAHAGSQNNSARVRLAFNHKW